MPDKQSTPGHIYEYPVVRIIWKRGNVTTASIGHLVQETNAMITLAGAIDAYGNPHEIRIIKVEHLIQMHYFGAGSTKPVMYLASPHSHQDPEIMHERYLGAMAAVAYFLSNKINVYSPILHSHPLAVEHDMNSGDFDDWANFDFSMISRCSEVYVLMLDGWRESKGVTAEIKYARQYNIPIRYVDPDTFRVTIDLEADIK